MCACAGDKHVIGLIEDDLETAAILTEKLELLGYEVVHFTNAEEAKQLADRGGVCLLIHDIAIKRRPDSIGAHPEAGFASIVYFRRRNPQRNKYGRHLFQIIVISGNAKDEDSIREVMHSDANSFLSKPFQRPTLLAETIAKCFTASGLGEHRECLDLLRPVPDGDVPSAPMPVARPSAKLNVTVAPDAAVDDRARLLVGGLELPCPNSELKTLLILAAARKRKGETVVRLRELARDEDVGRKAISRLRRMLLPHMPAQEDPVPNEPGNGYSLHGAIDVGVDQHFETHRNDAIRALAVACRT